MNSEQHLSYYLQTLVLQHENHPLLAELCFTRDSFSDLKQQMSAFLQSDELGAWKNLSYEKSQYAFLLGRFAAKKALNKVTSLSYQDFSIHNGIFNQPIIYSSCSTKLQVSLAHCEGLAVALLFQEPYPMGIDVEKIRQDKSSGIASQLTADELSWVKDQRETPEVLFTLLWTLKEALSKALWTGMSVPSKIYEVQDIQFHQNFWISNFTYFTQHEAISFYLKDQICSIVYPKAVSLKLDITDIQGWYSKPHRPSHVG